MNKLMRVLLIPLLLIVMARPLPAPISEESTPQPTPRIKRKAQPKSATVTKSSPRTETGMSSRSVQVVLTENTRAAILYLKNYVQTYESSPFAGKSDVHPDEILEQLRQALSTRFSNVSISDGSSSSRSEGLIMLFDLQARVGSISFTTNTVSFVATFKDGGRTIQSIPASGRSTIPYPAFHTSFPKAVAAAFADFSQKLIAVR
jgi:hypothetical protein